MHLHCINKIKGKKKLTVELFCLMLYHYIAALRHMTKECNEMKESATKLTSSLINVKATIAHFNLKIEAFSSQNQIVTLSEEQVLEVFRNNYDSLTLKFSDNLDQFEPYDCTKEVEMDFFAKILASIIDDYGNAGLLTVSFDEQHNLVQQIQNCSSMNMPYNDTILQHTEDCS